MVQPTDPTDPAPGVIARWLRSLRHRLGRWWPEPGPRPHPRDLDEETSRVQLELVLRAFGKDGVGGLPPTPGRGKDESYLCHPERVMVRSTDVQRLESFFNERRDTYRGGGRVSGELVGDLLTYELPARVKEGRPDVHLTLGEIDEVLRERVLCVRTTSSTSRSVEPARCARRPSRSCRSARARSPRSARTPGRAQGIRVSVVDTGWYEAAADNPETPLARRHRRIHRGRPRDGEPRGDPPLRRARHLRRRHHPLPRAGHHDRDRGRPHQGRRGLRVGHHQGAQRGDDGPDKPDS